MDGVQQKLYRARTLSKELRKEVLVYYGTDPGEMIELPESDPANPKFVFREKEPPPPQLALIAGDALQCLRSSLDYLIWELAEAHGKKPHDRLMFPICTTPKSYKAAIDGHRLDGIGQQAIALVDAFQPLNHAVPDGTVLAMLDSLTNVNKHRHVILTTFTGSTSEIPDGIPKLPYTSRMVNGSEQSLSVPCSRSRRDLRNT